MNGKELFTLLGELDENLVEDAWTEESGYTIIDEYGPLHFLKIAAAAAACVAAVTVGIYGFMRFNSGNVYLPNESDSNVYLPNKNNSLDISISVSSNSESSEASDTDEEPPQEKENSINIVNDNTNEFGDAEKLDNYDYAVIYIDETNASEDAPISVCIYGYGGDNRENAKCVSETIQITGTGRYTIQYSRLWGAGTYNILVIDPINENLLLKGNWLP